MAADRQRAVGAALAEADEAGAVRESDVSRGYSPWLEGGETAAREGWKRRRPRFPREPADLGADAGAAGFAVDDVS